MQKVPIRFIVQTVLLLSLAWIELDEEGGARLVPVTEAKDTGVSFGEVSDLVAKLVGWVKK
jgi:hypothetical protein